MIHRTFLSHRLACRRGVAAVQLLAALLLSGCAAPDSGPFEEFAASATLIQQSADAVLEYDYDLSRERFFARVEADDRADIGRVIQELRLAPSELEGDDFGWLAENEPLFLKIRRFRYAVDELNGVMVEYAELLARLAGPARLDDVELETFAADLNGNVKSAAAALALDAREEDLAIFSTVAAGLFQQYINSRQRSHLAAALRENQRWVEEVGRLGQEAARDTGRALWAEVNPLQGDFATFMMEEPSGDRRRELTESQMQFNEQFLDMLSALRTLNAAYGKLPDTHRSLSEGLETGSFNRRSIRQMYEYGKRLERLHEQLSEGSEDPPPSE